MGEALIQRLSQFFYTAFLAGADESECVSVFKLATRRHKRLKKIRPAEFILCFLCLFVANYSIIGSTVASPLKILAKSEEMQ